jgi:hypothetical protein
VVERTGLANIVVERSHDIIVCTRGDVLTMNCQVCALGEQAGPDGTIHCYKFERFMSAEVAHQSWGCRYYTDVIPGEDYTRQ